MLDEPDMWKQILDKHTGKMYYYNAKTGETTWRDPRGPSPEMTPRASYDAKPRIQNKTARKILKSVQRPEQAQTHMGRQYRPKQEKSPFKVMKGKPLDFETRKMTKERPFQAKPGNLPEEDFYAVVDDQDYPA